MSAARLHSLSLNTCHPVRVLWLGVLLGLALLVTGCSKQLLGSLDEGAANQVVSALRLEGVAADKSPAGEKFWKVTVPDEQFADAVQIMERHNLPSQQFQGLGQVFKKESLVSTPTEERARLIHAISQELERSLMEIDGVLVARVHPVILPHDPLNPKRSAATASVLIKYRPGMDVNGRESMVRALVAAGIEGLRYDDVRVVMVPAQANAAPPSKPAAQSAAPNSASDLQRFTRVPPLYLGVFITLVVAMVLSYLALVWRRRQRGGQRGGLKGRWNETLDGAVGSQDGSEARSARRMKGVR